MAKLLNQREARRQILQARHLVGRSPACALQISRQVVSGEHAVLSWTGEFWLLRDLGSRNGTYLDGRVIRPGAGYPLEKGNSVAFGTLENSWLLEEDTPPRVMAVPEGRAEQALEIQDGLLTLPSEDEPVVTIYLSAEGWVAEDERGSKSLEDGDALQVAEIEYRILLPEVLTRTAAANTKPEPNLLESQLLLSVSQDEEFVHMQVRCGDQSYDLYNRSHHYLVLLLARAQDADRLAGHPQPACGWLHREDLLNMLQTTAEQLNLMIYRLRQQFARKGFVNAANIIERRPATGHIRIGISRTQIRRL